MKPPDWLAARVTRSERATSIRCDGGQLGPDDLGPGLAGRSPRPPLLAATGRATRAPGWASVTRVEQHQQGLVVGERVTAVVHDGHVLAAGVEDRTEVGTGGPHQLATPGPRWPGGRRSARWRCWRTGLTTSTSASSLASRLGMTKLVGPEGVVEDQLEAGRRALDRSTESMRAAV